MSVSTKSSDIFEFLRNRFDLSNIVNAEGQPVTKPSDMAMFTFDYTTTEGKELGTIVISLVDDNESSNSVKIYYGKDVTNADQQSTQDFYKFLKELRMFAKSHMLGFDVRDVNRTRLTRQDINPVTESVTFGPLGGTIKTSVQPLENLKLIIKHSDKIDDKVPGSRSRRIHRIYIANEKGERFLLPFKNLRAARAMARHVYNGGIPYDEIGQVIGQLVDEIVTLSKFLRKAKRLEQDEKVFEIVNAAQGRHSEIKHRIGSIVSQCGYQKNKDSMINEPLEIYDIEEEVKHKFGDIISEESLPYVTNIYSRMTANKLKEEEEFTNWIKEGDNDPDWKKERDFTRTNYFGDE